MRTIATMLVVLSTLLSLATAQFGFFDQMFQGGQEQGQRQKSQNVPSDANFYRENYDQFTCDKYLCPDTLACVHFPHHCPCPFSAQQDKFELVDGHRICVSKGGFKEGEAARKVELARKGLL